MSSVALDGAPARPAFEAPPLPLCAHCGLPVAARAGDAPLYCCGGCALAHRITGGPGGHGREAGLLMSVGIGAFLAMNVMMLSFVLYTDGAEGDRAAGEAWVRWALLALATPALFLLGLPFLSRGLSRLRERALDADALVVLGVLAAWGVSVRSVLGGGGPVYLDTAMGILLFVTLGRYLEAAARAKTTDALSALVRSLPASATVVDPDGTERDVPTAEVPVGALVRVRPGERIPVDGAIREGSASVSDAEITGESLPTLRAAGDEVTAGALSLDGALLVETRRAGGATLLARLVRLVDEARAGRSAIPPLVDRVSRVFVPAVLATAVGTFAFWSVREGSGAALLHALSVLLIACPCAIGIALPLAFTAAIGRAASAGVLVRSGRVFEPLARTRRVFFDKTGTLTRGRPAVVGVTPAAGVEAERLMAVAASVESRSEHPLGRAVVDEAGRRGIRLGPVHDFTYSPGRGVTGTLPGGEVVRAGTADHAGGAGGEGPEGATRIVVTADGRLLGTLDLVDEPRPGAAAAVAAFAARGVAVEILSGDRPTAVARLAASLPGVTASAGLLPEEKLARVRASDAAGEMPVMVGDGVNDALALSAAGVGVTLEGGTDLAREVSDVTILGGRIDRLPWLVALAEQTCATARRNLFWAFFYNLIGLTLAVTGRLHPLHGAVAMILSSLLVVFHSRRLTRCPLPGEEPA